VPLAHGTPPDRVALTDKLTSYLMNGAVTAYGAGVDRPDAPRHGEAHQAVQDHKVQARRRALLGGRRAQWFAWNDAASTPDESFDPNSQTSSRLTARHGKVATLACMDCHAELISHDDFRTLVKQADGKRTPSVVRARRAPTGGSRHPPVLRSRRCRVSGRWSWRHNGLRLSVEQRQIRLNRAFGRS